MNTAADKCRGDSGIALRSRRCRRRSRGGSRTAPTRLWVWVLLLLPPVSTAFAHSFEPAVLDLHEREAGQFDVVWKLPGLESGSRTAGDEIIPQLPAHCRRLDHFASTSPTSEGPTYWRVDCGSAGLGSERLWVSGLAGSRVDVIVRIMWRNDRTSSGVLRSGADEFVVPVAHGAGLGGGAPARTVLYSYGRLGVEHILRGYDHLLFVLALVLLVESWGTLIKTISAFTAAHSLALALAILGVIHVPAAPVEALIAASIVLVALELTRPPGAAPTLTKRYPWVVAFVFGLLHGLGFAGALQEIGLPPDQIPLALLGFNLGVEVGQLVFVVAVVGPLALMNHLASRWSPTRLVTAYAIGALATAWALERIQRFWLL